MGVWQGRSQIEVSSTVPRGRFVFDLFKEWTKIQPSVNSYMEQLRSDRISREWNLKRTTRAREVTSMLTAYRNDSACPVPSAGDIYALRSVRATLLDGTDEEFATLKSDIVSRLPQLTAHCYERRRTTLIQLLPENLRERDALFLALTSFSCGQCRTRGLGAREAIHHTCGRYTWGPDFHMSLDTKENPWSKTLKGLSYCSLDAGLREKVVVAVGEDPATITDTGMDLGNHRFLTYSRFIRGFDNSNILSWRGLVSNVDLL